MGTHTLVIVGIGLALVLNVASAGGLYYIIEDDQGRTRMFDTLPPEYAQKGYRVVNESGATVEVVPPSARKRVTRRLSDDDRALLKTFDSVADLEVARDRQHDDLEAIIRSTLSTLEVIRRNLKSLSSRAASLVEKGEMVPEKLRRDIESASDQIESNEAFVDKKRLQQSELRKRYERDIARFQELKGRARN